MGILGIDLGGSNIRAGLVQNNKLIRVEAARVDKYAAEEEVLELIYALIESFDSSTIDGIGMGVPGVVDVKQGIVYNLQNIPSWIEVRLKEHLEKRYGVPAFINNDANCFAAGEKYFNLGRGYENIVGLIVGTGLGAGIIINNHLYSGVNCGAGEFGMLPFKDGILESYCSGQFFTEQYQTSGAEIFEAAQLWNPEALNILNEFGTNLGEAIKAILYTIDPQIIILGGSVSKSFSFFKDAMWRSINTFAYPNTVQNIRIEVSGEEHIAILGAAALYYDAMPGQADR